MLAFFKFDSIFLHHKILSYTKIPPYMVGFFPIMNNQNIFIKIPPYMVGFLPCMNNQNIE